MWRAAPDQGEAEREIGRLHSAQACELWAALIGWGLGEIPALTRGLSLTPGPVLYGVTVVTWQRPGLLVQASGNRNFMSARVTSPGPSGHPLMEGVIKVFFPGAKAL